MHECLQPTPGPVVDVPMAYCDLQLIEERDLIWQQFVILGLRANCHKAIPGYWQGDSMGVTNSDVWHHARVDVEVSKGEGGRVRDQQLVTNRDMQNLDGLGAKNRAHTAKHRLHARPYSGTARVQGTPLRDGLVQQPCPGPLALLPAARSGGWTPPAATAPPRAPSPRPTPPVPAAPVRT